MKEIPNEERLHFRKTLFVKSDFPLQEGPFSMNAADGTLTRYTDDMRREIGLAVGLTIVIIGGGVAGLAAACNCPRIYSFDEAGNQQLQGSLLSGAISRSFERQDLLALPNIDRSQKELTLRVANELPEVEYLNQFRLLKVPYRKGFQLGMDASEQLFEFGKRIPPIAAHSGGGKDQLRELFERDELSYEFEEETMGKQLSSTIVSFDNSQLNASPAKLLIHARQTQWLEQVTEAYFALHGSEFDKINRKMDKIPSKLYDQNMAKLGISLNAYVMTEQGWQKIGIFKNAGTTRKKMLGMDLPLEEVTGPNIQIKLESAFGFWEIDQIGITQDWKVLDTYEEVPLLAAVNHSGDDVRALIQSEDKQYLIQPTEGTYVDLRFENTATEEELYVLQGTGYYYHEREYAHVPEKQAIKAIRSRKKMAAHELSQLLHQYSETMVLKGDQ